MILALTLPLFSVTFLRLNLGTYHIAVPMAVLGLILSVFILKIFLQGTLNGVLISKEIKVLSVVCYLFLLWHMLLAFKSFSLPLASKEVFKLLIGLVVFWSFISLFPRDKQFIQRFIVGACISSSVLLSFLIYKYAFVLKQTFLGTDINEAGRFGKGQLSLYLAMIFPYAFMYFWRTHNKLKGLFPVLILTIALIYAASRSSWAAVIAGLSCSVCFALWVKRDEGLKMLGAVLVGVVGLIGIGFWAISQYVDVKEIYVRFISLTRPDEIPEELAFLGKHSYSVRWLTLQQAREGFTISPIVGVGLKNTILFANRITHNDYMAILVELGIVGEVLFLGILIIVWNMGRASRHTKLERVSWLSLAARASFVSLLVSSFFINTYTSIHFFVFLGLYVVIMNAEREVVGDQPNRQRGVSYNLPLPLRVAEQGLLK